jgi:hypothetical protein
MLYFTAQADIDEFRSGLNPTMNRFLEGCILLKKGVEHHNEIEVGVAVDSLNTDSSISSNTISINKWHILPVNTESVISDNTSFRFSDEYGREWIETNGIGPFLEKPSQNRDGDLRKRMCNKFELRLLPHSSATYKAKFTGICNLFMLSEPYTKCDLKLETNVTEIAVDEITDSNLWIASWKVPSVCYVTITITNNSDIESTIVLATD